MAALTRNAHRIGAVFYVLWGVLHLYAAYIGVELGRTEATGFAQGKLFQNSWNLAYIALVCIGVAAAMNWRNSALGFWVNAVTVSVTDIGFVVLILIPGYSKDLLGPILWLLALALTAIGYAANPRTR